MKKNISLIALSALVMGSALFTSCKKEEEPKKYAKINITHASPGNYDVNFIVGKDTLNGSKPLGYYNQTGYINIEAGSKTFAFKYAGVDTSFLDSSFNFKEDKNYSMYLIDSFHKAKPLFLSDDLSSPANGKAHLRVVYLSPNSDSVDIVRMIDTNSYPAFPKTNFKDVSSFTAFDPGVYNFEVRPAGTKTTLLKIPTIVLNNGKIYTIVVRGFIGAKGTTELKSDIFMNKM